MSNTEETATAAATVVSELTLGQRLKAERERQGMSPAKAADGIHLDTWAIDALESGDYSRLGPSVYAKGHLKRYADLLRLPSADILAAFDPRSADAVPTDQPGISMRMPAAESAERALPWRPMAAAAVVLLIIAGVVWWKPWHPRGAAVAATNRAAAAPVAAPIAEGVAQVPATLAVAAPVVSAPRAVAPAPVAGAAALSDSDPSAGLGRARLRLTCSADSWVDVHDAAGRRVYAGNCHAHSVRTVAGSAPLRVHLGAASGVQMDVNNRPVSIPAQFVVRNAADFAAGADGVLRALPSGSAPAAHPRG